MHWFLMMSLSASVVGAQTGAGSPRQPDVPWVPTSPQAVHAMLKLAKVTGTDTVYDLGCGDGRIVIAAASEFGAHGVGIDLNPALIRIATKNARRAGVENLVRFEEGDIFQVNLRPATVVTLYLSTGINVRLRPKLLRELRPGSRIVSQSFDMGGLWKPDRTTAEGQQPEAAYLDPKLFLWIRTASRPRASTSGHMLEEARDWNRSYCRKPAGITAIAAQDEKWQAASGRLE
jgi:ubiquinone/menaquinone biosynthesis C-methylase UbiE